MSNQQIVTLQADAPFEVEITGSATAQIGIIMVHGFGVKRDSRKLFTDIENRLPEKCISIRGDFSVISASGTEAMAFSNQQSRLKAIIQYLQRSTQLSELIFIGHSQGCFTVALAKPANSRILLLAPPVLDRSAKRFAATPGWSRTGSILDIHGESLLKRSDGSFTRVGSGYWDEFKRIQPAALFTDLAKHNKVKIIFAGEDNVLGEQDTVASIPADVIQGADHDFSGSARDPLVEKVLAWLSD